MEAAGLGTTIHKPSHNTVHRTVHNINHKTVDGSFHKTIHHAIHEAMDKTMHKMVHKTISMGKATPTTIVVAIVKVPVGLADNFKIIIQVAQIATITPTVLANASSPQR